MAVENILGPSPWIQTVCHPGLVPRLSFPSSLCFTKMKGKRKEVGPICCSQEAGTFHNLIMASQSVQEGTQNITFAQHTTINMCGCSLPEGVSPEVWSPQANPDTPRAGGISISAHEVGLLAAGTFYIISVLLGLSPGFRSCLCSFPARGCWVSNNSSYSSQTSDSIFVRWG